MASLDTLIINIQTTASGPVMREKIAAAFGICNTLIQTNTVTAASQTFSAGGRVSGSVSVAGGTHVPIGIIQIKPENTAIGVDYCYLSGGSICYAAVNRSDAEVSSSIDFVVLLKNNNIA